MTVIEAEPARPPRAGKGTALRDWVRALEATAPIDANPQRILPGVIGELAHSRGESWPARFSSNRPGRTSNRERALTWTYRRAGA